MPEPDPHDAPAAWPAAAAAPFEECVAVACMAVLVVITLLNVLTRYLTDQSFAWTEEISVFLMVTMTLAGASAAVQRDTHIRIEFVYASGDAARRLRLKRVSAAVSALVFGVLALLFARMVADEIRWAETSMGLGVPRWWFTAPAPVLFGLLTARCAIFGWRAR